MKSPVWAIPGHFTPVEETTRQFRNHTQHAIALRREVSSTLLLGPIAPAARIITASSCYSTIVGGIEIRDPGKIKGIEGLQPKHNDVYVIASQISAHIVADVIPERTQIAYPVTGAADGGTRDRAGTIRVKRLLRTV